MRLHELLKQTTPWLQGVGDEADIVISSRVRLARNLTNFLFLPKTTPEQKQEIEQHIVSKVLNITPFRRYVYCALNELSENDICLLFERHLISKEMALVKGCRSVIFSPEEQNAIMINEEDHLRIQCLGSGLCLNEIYSQLNQLDQTLESKFAYAFDSQFGYLTACPTNAGTGLRASVMLHLPGLTITRQMDKIIKGIHKHKLHIRGFYGEGSAATSDFYQLSNQISFGCSEEQIISLVKFIIPQILQYERQVRKRMVSNNFQTTYDMVHDAYHTLSTNKSLSSLEAMTCFSAVRLGIHLELIQQVNIQTLNHLFLLSQPAHLQAQEGKELSPEARDQIRAVVIQKFLGGPSV